jgi:tRNA threonylcarbamoyladenosine biosynthesis protein TsaE
MNEQDLRELTCVCSNLDQTEQLGRQLAECLQPGLVIGLDGTLGSGKTRLVQAIAAGLGIAADQVVSPTFTLCVPHAGRLKILHVDAYRINHQEEVDELGLDEEVEDGTVLLVEWAERIAASLPPLDIQVVATPVDATSRQYRIAGITLAGQRAIGQLETCRATQ